jgi:orotate phosphoribosyltransferase
VTQYPFHAEKLGQALAARFQDLHVDAVASPAIGGIVLGQEVARAMASKPDAGPLRAIFAERDSNGILTLRRGFTVRPGERVVVIEDVWTTGGSTFETIRVVEEAGGRVVAAGALIDRSGGRLEWPVRAEALLTLSIDSYDAAECPLCRTGQVAERPGSRLSNHAKP